MMLARRLTPIVAKRQPASLSLTLPRQSLLLPRPLLGPVPLRCSLPGAIRGFVANASTADRSKYWRRLAWFVHILRFPFLIGAVYSLGYQQGVVDSVRDPLKVQEGIFEAICLGLGIESANDVDIFSEGRPAPKLARTGWFDSLPNMTADEKTKIRSKNLEATARVGRRIIAAARTHIELELSKAVLAARERLEADKEWDRTELIRSIHKDEDVKFWVEAQQRIEGESMKGIQNWQYVLIKNDQPNAFVSEMLPQRLFVTTSLFDWFVSNDEELGMILGHEISHLVMAHSSDKNLIEFMVRGLELAVLMLDPTEGLLSLSVAAFLASMRGVALAAFSREHETEADHLGCILAARACFDTQRGSEAFRKMHDFDEAVGNVNKTILASHPVSINRFEEVRKQSLQENFHKYSHCDNLQRHIRRLWAGSVPPPH